MFKHVKWKHLSRLDLLVSDFSTQDMCKYLKKSLLDKKQKEMVIILSMVTTLILNPSNAIRNNYYLVTNLGR
jgi:hypothetical protein